MDNRTYRLPDFSVTSDRSEYTRAWIDLCKAVERFFPGYFGSAFDPAIRMERRRQNFDGTYSIDDSFTISTAAAILLTKWDMEESRSRGDE